MEFTFTLTEKESEVILNSLAQAPYIKVVDVINKMQKQANEQVEARTS